MLPGTGGGNFLTGSRRRGEATEARPQLCCAAGPVGTWVLSACALDSHADPTAAPAALHRGLLTDADGLRVSDELPACKLMESILWGASEKTEREFVPREGKLGEVQSPRSLSRPPNSLRGTLWDSG